MTCFSQTLIVHPATETVVRDRLASGLVGAKKRQGAIRELFVQAGCAPVEQTIKKSTANVICTLPGDTESTITIGAHFDFVEFGKGIVDDWSGTALLPSLYEALKISRRKHTFVFVAFAEEERGLVGSRHYVTSLTEDQKSRLRAFINLECLGMTPVKVWVHRSTPVLVTRLDEVARTMQIPLQEMNVEQVGDDDTHPFLNAAVPVVSIHSVTQNTLSVLHSAKDRLDAVHPNHYYTAYRLVAFYLAYLDLKLE